MTALFRHAEIHALFTQTRSLKASAFEGVLRGRTKTVLPDDFEKVINAYESITPDMYGKHRALSRRKVRIPFCDELKAKTQFVLEASSLSCSKLLRLHGAPNDLTNDKLCHALKRENTTIQKDHADFLAKLIRVRMK